MEKVKRNKSDRVLYIRDLNISFNTAYGTVHAIRGIRLDLFRGETIAIVGESGSGKSVTVKTIMGILDSNGVIDSGQIIYRYKDDNGEEQEVDLVKMSQKDIRYKFCGKHIAMVFQDPMTSLDPTMQIGKQIMEPMREHYHISVAEAKKRALGLLNEVGIDNPDKRFKQYPHELSGGMRQRVVIAIALACDPDILICDEPTTALDVTIQAKILEQLTIFRALNAVAFCAEQLRTAFFENPFLFQLHREIQPRLAADARQNRVGTLVADDLGDIFERQRLHVDFVRDARIGHNRRGVGVAQDDLVPFLFERQTRLRARVIEFRRLTDNDRPRAYDKYLMNIRSFRHDSIPKVARPSCKNSALSAL